MVPAFHFILSGDSRKFICGLTSLRNLFKTLYFNATCSIKKKNLMGTCKNQLVFVFWIYIKKNFAILFSALWRTHSKQDCKVTFPKVIHGESLVLHDFSGSSRKLVLLLSRSTNIRLHLVILCLHCKSSQSFSMPMCLETYILKHIIKSDIQLRKTIA